MSSRMSRWLGASKFPGTWKAKLPDGFSPATQSANRSTCPGTHCSVALLTIRSYGSAGVQVRTSAWSKSRRPPPGVGPW